MPFICPQCHAPSLEIEAAIELPPDSRYDEITFQIVMCSACCFKAYAVYQESRRGRLETEHWDHTGYLADPKDLQETALLLQRCPEPFNPRCRCSTHSSLGSQDGQGRWCWLDSRAGADFFRMELA